jgi:hypothetical protein
MQSKKTNKNKEVEMTLKVAYEEFAHFNRWQKNHADSAR